MPIVGFNFEKLYVERTNEKIINDLNIKHKINILNLEEEKVPLGQDENVLKFTFQFDVEYVPNVGSISIKGNTLYIDDQKKIKEAIKQYKKNRTIPDSLISIILNYVITRVNIKALSLSQDLNLPPHIPLPKIAKQEQTQQQKKSKDYIG